MKTSDIIRLLIIGVPILISVFQSIARSRRKSLEEAELNKQLAMLEAARREANPQTQSYQGYLQRTKPEIIESDDGSDVFGRPKTTINTSSPTENTFGADVKEAQERLRQGAARKMGSTPTPITSNTTQSNRPVSGLEELIRQLTAETPVPTAQPKPATTAKQNNQTARTPKRVEDPRALVVNKTQVVPEKQKPAKTIKTQKTFLEFGPNEIVRGIVLSEVLGPPKSRRR